MRLCSASCEARSSSLSTGICCSSATGLLSSSRHSTGSSSRNRLVVSGSQLHQRFCASAPSRWCAGATNCPSVRASVTIGASCAPAITSSRTSSALKMRGSMVCTTRTPCSSPRSTIGTPRNDRYGILARLREVLEARMRRASATTCGRSCSATSPARPSVRRIRTRPTLSARRPIVAASTRLARSGSSR